MGAYASFARYYDGLTKNVEYTKRADYLCRLLKKWGHEPGLTLDLACGTGTLTIELAKRGFDIYGVDGSMEMLSEAQQKAADAEMELLFLCQQMQRLDLYGTIDTVVCMLDSINHLTSEKDVMRAFQRVSLFMNPGALFVFDVNTLYKHREVLGNNTFVYDTDDVFCVWQNTWEPKTDKVRICLDFFERDGHVYHRSSEHFVERAYSRELLEKMLQEAGLEVLAVYGDGTFEEPGEACERAVFVARKPGIKSENSL